jgi:L-cystine uptake protein TcyP (sodium:dicarboxylate symporter family)
MTPATRRTHPLLIIGSVALWVGILGDSYLHLPTLLVMGILLFAVICMFLGIRAACRQTPVSSPTSVRQKHKRFAMLFAAVLVGCIFGEFVLPTQNAHFSLSTRVLIALASILTATGILVWGVYFWRRKSPE